MKSLYVTDGQAIGHDRLAETLEVLRGARDLVVQLREKNVTDQDCLSLARLARERLGPDVPLYVNRRFDIALAAGADGVHLPTSGLPMGRVKANTPRGFRVGVSTHSVPETLRAIEEGADLVLIGPIFDTPSKRAYGAPLSPHALGELPPATEHTTDVFVIGGIREESLDELEPYRKRISGVAGIRLFQEAHDPRAVVERIAQR
jgi:thiamine-phosphate pyrophosphorylase